MRTTPALTAAAVISTVPLVVSRRVVFPIRKGALSRWKYDRPRRYLAVSAYVAGIWRCKPRASTLAGSISLTVWKFPPAHGDTVITPYTTDPEKGMALAEEASALAGVPLVVENLERDLPHARAMIYLSQAEDWDRVSCSQWLTEWQ